MVNPSQLNQDFYQNHSTLLIDPRIPLGKGQLPKNLCIARSISEFDEICRKDKNILIHFWAPPNENLQKIANTPYTELPVFNETVKKEKVKNCHQLIQDPLGREILSSISPLVIKFANLIPEKFLKIAFHKTLDQSCPLFHVDHLNLRMLCTFRGPGTEWISNDMVNRNQLGKGSNRKVIKPEGIIRQLKPFQVCILKGESNNPKLGIVHRSPNVPKNQTGRWYMRIDTIK